MRRLTSRNVGFVGVLSCLVLMLALFFSTSVASAHSTQAAVHSQTSVTSVNTLKAESKGPYQTCKTVYVKKGGYYGGKYYPNGGNVKVCQTCKTVYVKKGGYYGGKYYPNGGNVRVCHY